VSGAKAGREGKTEQEAHRENGRHTDGDSARDRQTDQALEELGQEARCQEDQSHTRRDHYPTV
jgi:hypothetical protein